MDIFERVMESDKKLASNNTFINNSYFIHENMNAGKVRCVEICKNDKYWLTSVLFNLIVSMNITNERIAESNKLYKIIRFDNNRIMQFNAYYFAKYHKTNESIIHDIKLYCDKLIIISFLLIEDDKVRDLKIKSIGDYLKDSRHIYKNDEVFLNLINDLDNSYKHSFSNDMDPLRIDLNDNCIINYYSKKGKDIFNPQIISAKLDDVINGFNVFFDSVEKFCKENAKC